MWAMIPMFRVFSRGNARAATATAMSVPEVREGFVRLGHLVGVFLPLDRCAHAVGGVHQFAGELLGHAFAAATARVADDPAPRERLAAVVADLHGHLIGGSPDPFRFDLENRRDVANRLVEHVEGLLSRGAPDLLERVVDDLLGDALLTGEHDAVHELRQSNAPVDRVGQDDAFLNAGSAWHGWLARLLLALGAVLAAALLAVLGTGGVERSANDVVADTGEVADSASANEHHRVLLQVVADAGDVGGDLDLRGQTDTGHLPERRVGLLGRGRVHADADPAALRASPKRTGLGLVCRLGAALADQLLKGRHDRPFIENCALPRNSAREYEESSWSEAKAYQTSSSHVKPSTGCDDGASGLRELQPDGGAAAGRRHDRQGCAPALATHSWSSDSPTCPFNWRLRRSSALNPHPWSTTSRATPATLWLFQKTTRRRPFAEDRRCETGSRSISCAGGQGCRMAPSGAPRGRDPAIGGGTAPTEAAMAPTSTEKPQVTRAGSRKVASVNQLTGMLSRATSAVVTDYRGLTVRQLEELRGRLRAEGIDYIVVKNTLARRAAVDARAAGLADVLIGPVGLAIGYGDLSAPARILFEHFRSTRTLPLVAGLAEGQVLDGNEVRTLAELPPRDVLLSRLAAALLGPLSTLAAALDSPLSTLAATLEAYRDKLAA